VKAAHPPRQAPQQKQQDSKKAPKRRPKSSSWQQSAGSRPLLTKYRSMPYSTKGSTVEAWIGMTGPWAQTAEPDIPFVLQHY